MVQRKGGGGLFGRARHHFGQRVLVVIAKAGHQRQRGELAVHAQQAQALLGQLALDDGRRHGGHAQAVADHADHGRHRGDAVQVHRGNAFGREQLLDHRIGLGAARKAHDGKGRQLGQAQCLVANAQLGAAHPGHGKFTQRQMAHAGRRHGLGLQRQVQLALHQLLGHVQRGVAGDLHLQARIALLQQGQEVGEPAVHDGLDGADADHARIGLLVQHVLAHLAHEAQHALGMDQGLGAVGRQRDLAHATVEQAHAELLLQRGDAAGDGGLRGVQPLGRHAEIAQLGQQHKGFQEP